MCGERPSKGSGPELRVALLVNQYPRVSHSFVRREILMLERLGVEVNRFSIRRAPEPVVDPQDRAEVARTEVLLEAGPRALLGAFLSVVVRRPWRFAAACALAVRSARRARGRRLRHAAYLVEAAYLARLLERRGLSHLHAHFVTNSTTVAMLSAALGTHGFSFTVHRLGGPEDPVRVGLREKIRRADFVVAVSEAGAATARAWAEPGDAPKVVCIRCGLGDEELAPAAPPERRRRLVFVGRCDPEKGLLDLLDAMASLARSGMRAELAIVGDGPLRGEAEERAKRLGLGELVRFTGWLDAGGVRHELTSARALVLPSTHEGLPVVVMEAFAAGRPVVATAVGGVGELVESGRTGWLVFPGDTASLTRALREALSADVTALRAYAEEGRSRVLARHRVARNVPELAARLERAVRAPRERAGSG